VRRDQLEHAIRAACDVADDTEVIVFGSQAILGTHPEPPYALTVSIEVDMQPKNRPSAVDAVDGALGEMSLFHRTHGFYVHGLSIEAARLPAGWEQRTVAVTDAVQTQGNIGYCIEVHDLAASKLAAFRDKDREFVTVLLAERLIAPEVLLERIAMMSVEDELSRRMSRWVRIVTEDLGVPEDCE